MLPEMILTVAEIAAAVSGEINASGDVGDLEITRVTQDSREIERGMLFVPIVAERDGHDFIEAAIVAGASAYLTHRPMRAGTAGEAVDGSIAALRGSPLPPAIVVEDTRRALKALAAAVRGRLDGAAVIGITGSVGKTTTKDFLASVLSRERRVHASVRSYNNEIGVPLTVIAAPADAEALVVEMGARGFGHIAALCEVARPTVGVVTNVGVAHTSEFGSLEGVVRAKGELIEALPPEGLAVLNASVPEMASMADRTEARCVTFGAGGDLEAVDVTLDAQLRPRFRLVGHTVDVGIELGARGLHLVENAAAAALVALELGLSPQAVADGLAEPVLSPLRMELLRNEAGARIINDSYNANPMSTAGALRSLAVLPGARRTAVLGIMAELGEASAGEHAAIGELAAELGIRLIAVAAPDYGGEQAAGVDEAVALLGPLDEDDAVLVKGSRVAELERVVAALTG